MLSRSLCCLALVIGSGNLLADTVIDFEGLPDSTFLTTQYSSEGVTFSNAQILTAGISLNQFEFPPHSGVNVASDYLGPMSIFFTTPVSFVGGYFTYSVPLTLDAYGLSSNLLGAVSSPFSSNLALSGDPGSSPNEFLHLTSTSGISELIITGAPAGSSFALDDLTFAPKVSTTTPEPSGCWLTLSACVFILGLHAPRKRLRVGR